MYEYVYNDLKQQKMPKHVKCLLPNGKNTSSCILLDHFNAFGLSRNNFFCRKQRGRGGGV